MQKLILLTFFSFFILSCTEKEKTYEELEAEVLCDVLPEVISIIDGGGPIPENKNPEELNKIINYQIDSISQLINLTDKYSIGIQDTLYPTIDDYLLKKFNFRPFKKNLEKRKVEQVDFQNSILNIDLYSKEIWPPFTIKPGIKPNQIIYQISRVILNEEKDKALVIISRSISITYVVLCEKKNKWITKEISIQ